MSAPGEAAEAIDSVSFDRAAPYYDRTRALPDGVAEAQTEQLIGELRRTRGPCLEIGVGTGRVALPLVDAGVPMVGLDLSQPMLTALVAKHPGALPVVCGDATRLPFGDRIFGAAVAAHVLHLVADWRRVTDELLRVLRPAGLILVTRGAPRDGVLAEVQARIRAAAGIQPDPRRLDDLGPLDDYLQHRSARVDVLPEIPVAGTGTIEHHLRRIEEHVLSWTWPIAPDTLRTAVAEVRTWVNKQYGDPETVEIPAIPLRWRAYRLPG